MEKGRDLMLQLEVEINKFLSEGGDGCVGHKILEKIRGVMCHLAMMYDILAPYLKGLHLTLDGWRMDRNKDGWKRKNWAEILDYLVEEGRMSDEERETLLYNKADGKLPERVEIKSRLKMDVKDVIRFLDRPEPIRALARFYKVVYVTYGFINASKEGFGTSEISPSGTKCTIGVWGRDDKNHSSNWYELANGLN